MPTTMMKVYYVVQNNKELKSISLSECKEKAMEEKE